MATHGAPRESARPLRPLTPPLPPRPLKRRHPEEEYLRSAKQARETRDTETWVQEVIAEYIGWKCAPLRQLLSAHRAALVTPSDVEDAFGARLLEPSRAASPRSRLGAITSPFEEDNDDEDTGSSQANDGAQDNIDGKSKAG